MQTFESYLMVASTSFWSKTRDAEINVGKQSQKSANIPLEDIMGALANMLVILLVNVLTLTEDSFFYIKMVKDLEHKLFKCFKDSLIFVGENI